MNLKHSKQRDSIKEFLATRKDHPTAEVIYANVRQSLPNISLGTVYRNLNLLTELGEITRLRLGDGIDHFDYDTSPHCHFICSECGSVIDLDTDMSEHVKRPAEESFDGEIKGRVIYFYGHCGNCIRKRGKGD